MTTALKSIYFDVKGIQLIVTRIQVVLHIQYIYLYQYIMEK